MALGSEEPGAARRRCLASLTALAPMSRAEQKVCKRRGLEEQQGRDAEEGKASFAL